MERLFQILAIVFAAAAGYFAWAGADFDRIFTAVVLACCSLFLSFRFRLSARVKARLPEPSEPSDVE